MTAHKRRHTTQPFALCKLSYTKLGWKIAVDVSDNLNWKYLSHVVSSFPQHLLQGCSDFPHSSALLRRQAEGKTLSQSFCNSIPPSPCRCKATEQTTIPLKSFPSADERMAFYAKFSLAHWMRVRSAGFPCKDL